MKSFSVKDEGRVRRKSENEPRRFSSKSRFFRKSFRNLSLKCSLSHPWVTCNYHTNKRTWSRVWRRWAKYAIRIEKWNLVGRSWMKTYMIGWEYLRVKVFHSGNSNAGQTIVPAITKIGPPLFKLALNRLNVFFSKSLSHVTMPSSAAYSPLHPDSSLCLRLRQRKVLGKM